MSRYPTDAADRGYVVVTPQAVDVDVPVGGATVRAPLWNISDAFIAPEGSEGLDAGDDVAFLMALLDSLEDGLCVDTAREYVSGISNGAGMTVVLMCTDDRRFAAVAPVAGVNAATLCNADEGTPVITFHGDADTLIAYEGGSLVGYDLGNPSVEQQVTNFAVLGGCDPVPRTTRPFDDIRHLVWDCPPGYGRRALRGVEWRTQLARGDDR